jgi:hypothetical protein
MFQLGGFALLCFLRYDLRHGNRQRSAAAKIFSMKINYYCEVVTERLMSQSLFLRYLW